MSKIFRRYTKGLRLIILMIACLLFAQAQFELSLPDYMSNIVSNGIQNKGIDYQVPKVLDEKTYQALVNMSDNPQVIKENYKHLTKVNKNDYFKHQPTTLYVLRKDSKQLDQALKHNLLLIQGFKSIDDGKKVNDAKLMQLKAKLPPKMIMLDYLIVAPKAQLKPIVDNFEKQIKGYGDSALATAMSGSITELYKEIGINTDRLQYDYIIRIGSKMLALTLGAVIIAIIVSYLATLCATKISRKIRHDLFTKIISFGNDELNEFSNASLITRTTNDVQQMQFAIISTLRIVFYSPIIGIGAIIRVMNSSVSMVWIISVVVIVIIGFIGIIMMICMPKVKKMQTILDKLNLVLRENLNGMLVVRAFHNEKKEEERFDEANQNCSKTQYFTTTRMGLLVPVISFIMNGTSVLIIWMGAHQINDGIIQIGEMMAFMQYTMQIIMSFMMVTMIAVVLPRASVAAKRCLNVLDQDVKINLNEEGIELKHISEITFEHVSFKYPQAKEYVLKDLNFTISKDLSTAVIGSTGCGKTTLMQLLIRLYDPSEGVIKINGIDLKKYNLKSVRAQMGIVFQNASLFKGDVYSNLSYGLENVDQKVMEKALKEACADFVLDSKEGLHYPIAQKGSNVSGGQRQRIAIARALVRHPQLYVFDDSFSALDFKTDAKIRQNIMNTCKQEDASLLIIGQRIATIMNCKQILVLDEGKIVGCGNHDFLLKNCPLYEKIAASQFSKEELGYEKE